MLPLLPGGIPANKENPFPKITVEVRYRDFHGASRVRFLHLSDCNYIKGDRIYNIGYYNNQTHAVNAAGKFVQHLDIPRGYSAYVIPCAHCMPEEAQVCIKHGLADLYIDD